MYWASRVLTWRNGKNEIKIPIQVTAPLPDGRGAWACKYEIDWPGDKRMATATGIDSMQAIILALQMIGSEVYSSEYHKSGNLFFDAAGRGYGFPVAGELRDLLIGDDRRYM